MTVKIYCDVCGALIPEECEGEGEDAGQLLMGWGAWGERLVSDIHKGFDYDALCEECHKSIKEAILNVIETIQKPHLRR